MAKAKANTVPVVVTLKGRTEATAHAGLILKGQGTILAAAHDVLRDLGMIDRAGDGPEVWKGFPEGFSAFLPIAKAITPQPMHRNDKGAWVRMSRANVEYIPPRDRAKVDTEGKPVHTEAEVQHSKDVHVVSQALSDASLDYGRPATPRPGSADSATGNAPKAPKVTPKDAASAAKVVARVLTGDKVTTPATRSKVVASLAEQIDILAARGGPFDPALVAACERLVAAAKPAKVSPAPKVAPAKARMLASQVV